MNKLRRAAFAGMLVAGSALAEGVFHYSTPGWYRFVEWFDNDGETVIDGYLEAGPFQTREACEATLPRYDDPANNIGCDWFDKDPD